MSDTAPHAHAAHIIRPATVADAATLAELGARTFVETFAADNSPADMAAYLAQAFSPAQQTAELRDPRNMFLLAELDGTASGYAQLCAGRAPACVVGPRPVELARLYVAQAWLGRGVGAALMSACLAAARRDGYETVWLGVWEHNARAQAFYRKWGFSVVGSHPFLLGTDRQTDWLMARPLAADSAPVRPV